MKMNCSDYVIDPDFIRNTNEFILSVDPYSRLSPASQVVDFLEIKTPTKFLWSRASFPAVHEREKEERYLTTQPVNIKHGEAFLN